MARAMFRAGAAALALSAGSAAWAQALPSPFTSAVRYDAMGRTTGTIAPDPNGAGALKHSAVRNTSDLAGRLIKVEHGELSAWHSEAVAPASWSGFDEHRTLVTVYDNMGRKVRDVLSSDGVVRAVTQYSYDVMGRLQCSAVRMNPAAWPNAAGTGGSLPASACTAGTPGTGSNAFGADRITREVWDAAGQRVQRRIGVGSAEEGAEATWARFNGQTGEGITSSHDGFGRLVSSSTSQGGYTRTLQYVHDRNGNGNRAELSYDSHGRQDRWTFPSETGT